MHPIKENKQIDRRAESIRQCSWRKWTCTSLDCSLQSKPRSEAPPGIARSWSSTWHRQEIVNIIGASIVRHLIEFQQETRIYWGFFVLFFWAKMKKASIVFKLSFILFITRFTLVAYLSWKPYFFLYPTYPYGALLSILVVCSRNLMLTGAPFLGLRGLKPPQKLGGRKLKIL